MADKSILTKQDDEFAKNLFLGDSQIYSYRKAFKQSKNWKDETVYVKASVLAKTDKIKIRLKELQDKMKQRVEDSALMTASDVLKDIKDIIDATKKDSPKTALKGLELYGKHLKMFTDKLEVSGEIKLRKSDDEIASRIKELESKGKN